MDYVNLFRYSLLLSDKDEFTMKRIKGSAEVLSIVKYHQQFRQIIDEFGFVDLKIFTDITDYSRTG